MVGTTVSHYRILEKLGEGGMGVVYKVHDTKLDRDVALKFLPQHLTCNPEAKERFIREAQAASALQHNNICVIHDIDETSNGQMFIAMECYDGETVKKKIEQGPLPIEQTIDIAIQVTEGLQKAHEHGILHRDIKPANILVTTDGVVKLLDFGLAKLAGRTMLTKPGTTLGTVLYMSPEQAHGDDVDRRTDIWSLGVVLYEMVVGKPPFKGDYENAVIYEIVNSDPEPVTALRTGVPMALERIITKAMAKSPDERYQHIDEMGVDLRNVRRDIRPAAATKKHQIAGLPKQPARRRLLLPALLLALLVAAFVLLKPLLFDETLVSEPKPVAVIAFVNQTGEQSYDYLREAIPNLLITSLEQSKYLRVLTWERMNDLLKQMGRPGVNVIDKELGFELCRREGIHTIVLGTFVKAGETFATDVKVLDVDSKELLKSASARGEGVQSILNTQIDQLSREIARGVGLSLRKVESAPSQIAEVTTSSMDAYNLFLRGRAEYEKLYYPEARNFLEHAVALDSNFALAYLYLSKTYDGLIEFSKAIQATKQAKALSSRAPEKERLAIEARYAARIEKNPQKQLAFLEELVTKYPDEKRFHNELGQAYQERNRFREAQQEFEAAIRLDPDFAIPVNGLAYVYIYQDLYEQAVQTFQRYAALSPGDANPYNSMGELYLQMGDLDRSVAEYSEAVRVQPSFSSAYRGLAYTYALKEDYDTSLRWIDSLLETAPTIGVRVEAIGWKVTYLLRTGRFRQSRQQIDLMGNLVQRMGSPSLSAPLHWMNGSMALIEGKIEKAWQEHATFRDIFARNNPQSPVLSRVLGNFCEALVYLRENRTGPARVRVDIIRSSLDSIESLRSTLEMLTGIHEAELLLAEGHPDSAIQMYRATPAIGVSMAMGWRMPLYNTPLLHDVVPRAFQQKGESDSAIVEYERLLRIDPNTKDRRLINPLYHYRLATLCKQAGKSEEAAAQYKRFLQLWTHADSDRPELIDANRQLAKLTRQ